MTLGNMRENGARSLFVDLPSPNGAERGSLARRHSGANIRPADGVYRLRHHRRGRAAELARAAAA
jgi:hypothetical protein